MSHVSRPTARQLRARLIALLAAITAIVGFAAPAQAADEVAPLSAGDFCKAWHAARTGSDSLQLENGLNVSGDRLSREGSGCTAPGAAINVSGAEIEQESESAPTGTAAARVMAAVTSVAASTSDLKDGDEIFKGAVISGLQMKIQIGYAEIAGYASISWSGGTVTKLYFRGRLYGVDRYSVSLASPAGGTVLPNVGGDPIDFSGSYVRTGATGELKLKADVSSLTIGSGAEQISVTDGKLDLSLAQDSADSELRASIAGTVGIGQHLSATATLAAEFDDAGMTKVSGAASDLQLTVPASGNTPQIEVGGSGDFTYTRDPLVRSVAFDGTVKVGDSLTAAAKGTIDDDAVSFAGTVTFSNADLAIEGGVDGILFYGDNLAGRTIENAGGQQVAASKGDVLIKSAGGKVTAKGLELSGALQYGNVGGQEWAKAGGAVALALQVSGQPDTEVNGSADLTWTQGSSPKVSFAGSISSGSVNVASVQGSVDGNKLTFAGNGELSNPDLTIKGGVQGVVFYGDDLTGETIVNGAGETVPAGKGDYSLTLDDASLNSRGFALTGKATIGRVGGKRFASGGGSVDLTSGASKLVGSASLTWVAGEQPAVTFDGTVTSGATKIEASGEVDGKKLILAGTVTQTGPDYTATGSVNGVVFYGTDLSGETITDRSGNKVAASKGDYLVNSASGKVVTRGLTLSGEITLGQVGGERWATGGGAMDLTANGTTLKGSVDFDWTEGKPIGLGFTGSVTADGLSATAKGSVDGKKLSFSGDVTYSRDGVTVKGAAEGVVFYGADLAGETIKDAAGNNVAATKGDYALTSASGQLNTNGLTLGGGVAFGNVGGKAWAKADGSVDISKNGTTVKGSASVAWAAGAPATVAFEGSLSSDKVTASAKGSIDGKKLTFRGNATLSDGSSSVKGAIDGVYYYGSDLTGETVETSNGPRQASQGDYILTSASGEVTARGLMLKGEISIGKVGSDGWASGSGAVDISAGGTSIKGSADFSWSASGSLSLRFDGTIVNGTTKVEASGYADDKKIWVSGTLSSPTVSGSAHGVVYHGTDLAGETVTDRSGKQIPASRGDFSFTLRDGKAKLGNVVAAGDLSANKVGGYSWANAKVSLKISQSWLDFSGTIDSNGTFDLKGSGSVNFDGTWLDFTGQASLSSGRLLIYGSVQVRTDLFAVQLSGTIEKADVNSSSYVFTGKANFKFAGYSISNATVRISTGEGLSTNFDLRICVWFVCSSAKYKLYFTGSSINRAELDTAAIWVPKYLAIGSIAMPRVPISTQITGII